MSALMYIKNFFIRFMKKEDTMSNYVGYRKKLQKSARDIIRKTPFPPRVEPTKYESEYMNCYSFALNLPIEDPEKEFFSPGCISNPHGESAIWDSALKWMKKDLYYLGLKFREIDLSEKDNFVLNDGEYAIAIYREISTFHDMPFDFHMIRRDQNGMWHDKNGWKVKFNMYSKLPDLTDYNLQLEGILAISKK